MKRTIFPAATALAALSCLLMVGGEVRASSYIEARVAMGAISRTWIDGDKRREEIVSDASGQGMAALLQLAGPMGNQIKITRPDRGVEWTLYPALKSYSERPLALPYPPPENARDGIGKLERLPDAKESRVKFDKLPGSKTVAGFTCEGYTVSVTDTGIPQGNMQTWVAPIKAPLDGVLKEQELFEKKLREAEYAKWPDAERIKMQKDLENFALVLSKGMGFGQTLQGLKSVPQGFPMLIEIKGGAEGGQSFLTGTVFEVISVKNGAKPADGFDLPSGWKKTSEEAVARASGAQMIQKLFEKHGAEGGKEDGSTEEDAPGQKIPQNLQDMLQHLQGTDEDPQERP